MLYECCLRRSNFDPFEQVQMASTANIVDCLREETFKAGDTICTINEPADKFWIIMDGWIQVKKEVS